MTEQQHPITPPPELRQLWVKQAHRVDPHDPITKSAAWVESVTTQASRWGADQELEACLEWLNFYAAGAEATDLRAARRPKPPSLAEQALKARDRMWNFCAEPADWELVRAALERLQELEAQ